MTYYKCTKCSHVIENDLPPFKCQQCAARGKGVFIVSNDPPPQVETSETPSQTEEKQRLEEQRLEEQRLEEQRLEEQRLEEQRLEEQRLEEQRLEEQRQRAQQEQAERERQKREQAEKDRLEQVKREKTRLEEEKRREALEREQARHPPSRRKVWTHPETPAADEHRTPLRNCPAVNGEGRIFACLGNKLVALAPGEENVQVLWEYATGGVIPGSPCIGRDEAIRFHSSDGFLHMVDSSGTPCFEPVAVGEPLGWASPLADENNNTWICRSVGGLLKIDPQGKKTPRPFLRARSRLDCTGFIHQDVLYIGGENACVFAVRLSGERGENLWDHAQGEGRTGRFINAALARTSAGLIIAASCDDHLYAFHENGQLAWKEEIEGPMLAAPVVDDDDSIYVAACLSKRGAEVSGVLLKIDGRSHKIAWRYPVQAAIESTPVIGDDGVVYFGDNQGFVHAVDSSGDEQWRDYVGSPVRSAGAMLGEGRVVFGLDSGALIVLRCESNGLRANAWPKYMAGQLQTGIAPLR